MARKPWAKFGLVIMFALGVGSGIFFGAARKRGAELDPAVLAVGAGAIALFTLVLSLLWWRSIDEAQREAHKTAWFWGGSFGMLAALVGVMGARYVPGLLPALNPDGDPFDYVMLGLAGSMLAQSIGYGLVWAGWWWRTRS